MPVERLKNPYKGVNAHLNSLLQTPGTEENPALWHSFHTNHIGHIADFLNGVLPENYIALSEQSLQIRSETFEFGGRSKRREPDVSIYARSVSAAPQHESIAVAENVDAPEVALEETLQFAEEFTMSAVVIREVNINQHLGGIVTRLELLSPSNKPGEEGHEAYQKGRNQALFSHIPLIEIDYLHETPLPLRYRRERAYYIVINDPRPDVASGKAKLHGFGVNVPFPIVKIPLAGSESLTFDFGAVYHHTFECGRRGMLVDYAVLPERFETYSAEDQEQIRAVMEQARESAG